MVTYKVPSIYQGKTLNALPLSYQVRNNRELRINVSIYDEEDRIFDNFTSLGFIWKTSNDKLVSFVSTSNERAQVLLSSKEGSCIISINAKGFDASIVKWLKSIRTPTWHLQETQMELVLKSNVQVMPTRVTIYIHPLNQLHLRIVGGSGRHQVSLNDTQFGQISSYETGAKHITFNPGY